MKAAQLQLHYEKTERDRYTHTYTHKLAARLRDELILKLRTLQSSVDKPIIRKTNRRLTWQNVCRHHKKPQREKERESNWVTCRAREWESVCEWESNSWKSTRTGRCWIKYEQCRGRRDERERHVWKKEREMKRETERELMQRRRIWCGRTVKVTHERNNS